MTGITITVKKNIMTLRDGRTKIRYDACVRRAPTYARSGYCHVFMGISPASVDRLSRIGRKLAKETK